MKIKQKILLVVMVLCAFSFTSCSSEEKKLEGTWYVVADDGVTLKEKESVSFYEDGKIEEDIGIFDDSYGISYEISDGKILFIYYSNIAEKATYQVSGDKLTLQLEKEGDTVILQKK